jgi:hypothetical protein
VSPHDPQQGVVADRQHQPAGKTRRRSSAEREPKVMDDVVEPRRAPRPRHQHGVVEALGENAPPAQHGVAMETPRPDDEPNWLPSHRQVR